jgi:hypothetical protein
MQSSNDLVVLVESSVNRANYLSPMDFECFKESGGIEYTADVVWGLQLQALNEAIFNSDKKTRERRERVRDRQNGESSQNRAGLPEEPLWGVFLLVRLRLHARI